MRRSYLFLQGPATPFFACLADRLRALGHEVHRVHFCAGDVVYWGDRPGWWFRGSLSALSDFLDEKYRRYGITDQVLFGDRRPIHRPAVECGGSCGVRTWVFEEGYFRPYWVTLEKGGVNGHSLLPRDPAWFYDIGERLTEPEGVVPFVSLFRYRAIHDVLYHAAGVFNPILFPHYRNHAPYVAPVEYAGYLMRFSRLRIIRAREAQRVREIVASRRPYFVLPLQLNSDAQIRDHSRFSGMDEVMEYVLESFAKHAPADTIMVIKNHPLDPGLENHARVVKRLEHRFDLHGRVVYLEDGDLITLVRHARGCVTVNSTSGLVALEQGTPTLTLSDPIYNLQGLTCQVSLDAFWRELLPPNAELFRRFRRVVIHATQINGSFYCSQGIQLAVEHASRVLVAEKSPLEKLL